MKKSVSLLIILMLVFNVFIGGCGIKKVDEKNQAQEIPSTILFTDDCGREVELPANIERIAPSGNVAAMFLGALCPESLVSINNNPSENQMKYLPDALATLPDTGAFYGSKADLNLEQLLATGAQVIIDIGEAKKGIDEDLNELQKQVGIPVIFIQADLENMASAFRKLGVVLTTYTDRCEQMAQFIEKTLDMVNTNSAKITDENRKSVFYTTGVDGLGCNPKGSYQAQVIELIGAENAAVVENISNRGGDNQVNMEQIYQFAPDVIVFSADSIFDTVGTDSTWENLKAISSGNYYEIPDLPYNWLSSPPSLNMVIGIWWLGNLVYPEIYDYDIKEVIYEYYDLLWNYQLTDDELTDMLSKSTLK